MTGFSIYVGLNDTITKTQLFSTEKYVNILKNVCKNYKVSFSLEVIQGGYVNQNGDFSEETALRIDLINQKKETVDEIAKDLCTFFNQESVMITQFPVVMYFIQGDKDVMKKMENR